jgi:phosphate transport system permease protein
MDSASARSAPAMPDAVLERLSGKRFDGRNLLFESLLLAALFIALLFLMVLLAQIFSTGISVFRERGMDFVTSTLSSSAERAGVWQGITGSLFMMIFVVALAFPLGVGTAIYLEEYASDSRLSRFINVNIRNLAGVPSIVYGLLGFAIFVQAIGAFTGGSTIMSGGLTLAILVLPIVIIAAAEAIRAVPDSIREAGYGVGATKWEVVRSLVLPSAAPGILTGTVLALSRALGESAPLLLVGAITGFLATGDQSFVETLRGPFTALPIIIFSWARQADVSFEQLTAAAIIVLLLVILLANGAAILLRNRYDRKW